MPQESLLKQCRERRRQAFTEFKNQPLEVRTQKYELSQEAITLIESYGVDIEDYLICVGNQFQRYIHGELTQLLETAAQHAGEEVDVIVDMVTDTAQAGVHYCKNLCVIPAITMSDVGYAILDFSKGVLVGIAIEGAIAGTVCLVSVTCPVLAPAVHMGLRALYYYHVANATIYVAKEAFDCIEIVRTSQTNEEFNARMAKKGEEFKEAIKEVCSPYNIGMAVGGAYGAQKVNNWFANRLGMHHEAIHKNAKEKNKETFRNDKIDTTIVKGENLTTKPLPSDNKTFLASKEFRDTGKRYGKAKIYKKGNYYYYRDLAHKGQGFHIEVFNKRGDHVGTANPYTGEIDTSRAVSGRTIKKSL